MQWFTSSLLTGYVGLVNCALKGDARFSGNIIPLVYSSANTKSATRSCGFTLDHEFTHTFEPNALASTSGFPAERGYYRVVASISTWNNGCVTEFASGLKHSNVACTAGSRR